MLRHRIHCIRPPNVGVSYFPGAFEVLRSVPRDQDVGANHARSSRRQARTSCELKPMHRIDAGALGYADVDQGSVHVDKVELSADADSTDYAVQRLMERRRPDFRGHTLHIDADQALACSADRLRTAHVAHNPTALSSTGSFPPAMHLAFLRKENPASHHRSRDRPAVGLFSQ